MYVSPQLTTFGSVEALTKASFDNSQKDSIFFNGVPVGNAIGSMDACVSNNPQVPSGTCQATPVTP